MSGIPHNGKQTVIVTSANFDKEEGKGPLINFELELNPLSREGMDMVLKTTVKPLRITYDEASVK